MYTVNHSIIFKYIYIYIKDFKKFLTKIKDPKTF